MPGGWWNSRENTTLDDNDTLYAEQMAEIRRLNDEAAQRREQYERLVAEGYYDEEPGALDIRRN